MRIFANELKNKDISTMARPIKETPILYGADAIRFAERAEKVESMTREERTANRKKWEEGCKRARKYIEICW